MLNLRIFLYIWLEVSQRQLEESLWKLAYIKNRFKLDVRTEYIFILLQAKTFKFIS